VRPRKDDLKRMDEVLKGYIYNPMADPSAENM
jgi:hypothetical protein